MKSKIIILLLLVSTSTSSFSQWGKSRMSTRTLTEYLAPFERSGWFLSPGFTMNPKFNFKKYEPTLSSDNLDVNFTALNLEQQSKLGFYLEFGRYHIFALKQKGYPFRRMDLLSYVDYGIAYKQFRGSQSYDLRIEDILAFSDDTISYTQKFNSHNASLFYNANSVYAFSGKFFMQNSLGLNVDYAFSRKIDTTDVTSFVETYQEEPSKLMGGLHYKFGLGFKFGKKMYIIPSIEIPLLNAWKWEGGRSTVGYFNSRYRPLIVSVRFAWLRTPDCPRVWDNTDIKNTDTGR